MQVVAIYDHRDQLVTQHKGDNDPRNGNDHGIGQVLDHGEDPGIPSLRGFADLRSNGSGFLIYIGEHGSQIARYESREDFTNPILYRTE